MTIAQETAAAPATSLPAAARLERAMNAPGNPPIGARTEPPDEPPRETPGAPSHFPSVGPPSRQPRLITPRPYRPPGALAGLRAPRLPWRGLLLAALLLPGLGAAWFVFEARAVAIASDPPGAIIVLPGLPAPHWHGRWLLLPGSRRVIAQAPGYVPFDGTVEVGAAALQDLTVPLTRLPGALRVTLTPALPAQVLIDDVARGDTPDLIGDIPAGPHEVEVRAPRYRPFRTRVDIEGKGIEQTLAVTLEPAWTTLSVTARPAGARLGIDEQDAGPTPFSGEILEGRRVLRLAADGYKPWRRTVEVVAGTPLQLGTVTLDKLDGRLELASTPSGASVFLDGVAAGRTPVTLNVSPGARHRLRLETPGFEAFEQDVEAEPGTSRPLTATLAPELGTVDFVTEPATAELLIDGESRGSATQTVRLPAHAHEIVVRAPGYASYLGDVTPRKGVDKRYRIRLKTPAELAAEDAAAAASAASSQSPVAPASGRRILADASGMHAASGGEATAPDSAGRASTTSRDVASGPDDAASPSAAFRLFRPGRVRLGAPPGEPPREGESAAREVLLERPFLLGTREVTNGEFRRFRADHVSPPFRANDLDDDRLPVSDVDWREAAMYCNWLSRRDGLPPFYRIEFGEVLGVNPAATGYRLPTADEWEWAARTRAGGATTIYAWGDHFPPQGRSDNFADAAAARLVNGALTGYRDGYAVAAPVGSFSANLQGLYDMGGNVAEWVHDFDGPVAGALEADAGADDGRRPVDTAPRDPLGPATGSRHLIKGASWARAAEAELRLAHQDAGTSGRYDVGLRLARYAQ